MTQTRPSERPRTLKAVAGKTVAPQISQPPAEEPCHNPDWFGQFAAKASALLGTKWAFAMAALVIVVWALSGPLFHFSDTWQLVINTGTTIVTFLMVFLIQNTQNRDARAINLKLNELIRAIDAARDQMIDIESLSDLELNEIQARYGKIKADIVAEAAAQVTAEVTGKQA